MSENSDLNAVKENEYEKPDQEIVKSIAVVKYSAPKPATFAKLQCNTDLNLPPSNWLSSSADSYGLQRVIYHQKEFSSFRMAHMFPDCVGEVDVVSDAENIKNLLKIPYNKSHISMMVHRVENTLLLDDFDIYKHLLKTSETEWEWLKKFFFDNVDRESYEEDKQSYIKNRTQKALKQKSLVSKFFYHSLVQDSSNEENSSSFHNNYPLQQATINTTLQTPPLPEPEEHCPDSTNNNNRFDFNRNVVWTFEDIDMLIGTDMPIFGGGTHPCISLRLRDMNKPISVLTGIDYWLDNLMSNVPEVVMCYHLNGIVQKYELIKTEDLPRLDNSKFSPKLIRDVAQSILSFLKSNATKAGHTYWLFKGKDDEVVKLYDLTSLCSEEDVQKGQNPFTIPVAMLLYRVARNMNSERGQPGAIRMLLKNVVKLLSEEKYPEIVTSSHYMLSDLYIPSEIDPQNPNLERFLREDDEGSVYDDDDDDKAYIATLDLEKPNNVEKFCNSFKSPPPLTGSLMERCIQAIGHVADGLNCLQYFNEKNKNINEKNVEEEIPMAKPFEPIPMPYNNNNNNNNVELKEKNNTQTIKNSKRNKRKDKKKKEPDNMALLVKDSNDAAYNPKFPTFDPEKIAWKEHLKTLLFEKVILVYATLVEHYIMQGRFGDALRVLGVLGRCQLALDRVQLNKETGHLKLACLLGRAGDTFLFIVKNWNLVDSYREQLHSHYDEDVRLLEKLEQDERASTVYLGDSYVKVVFIHDIRTQEQILFKTLECYETANKISPANNLAIRLGNCLNELGNYHLNLAKNTENFQDCIELCRKSEEFLTRGLQIFENLNNNFNIALLNSNMGHLNRLLAYVHTPEKRVELTHQERKYHSRAFQHYKCALRVIGDRKENPTIWDAVSWELSTSLYTVANIMYDFPSAGTKSEIDKQIIEALNLALEYCDLNESNPKVLIYQYRAGNLNFKIARTWHKTVTIHQANEHKKNAIQLAQKHYKKAKKLYLQCGDPSGYFTTQRHEVNLQEVLINNAKSNKLKCLENCLKIFLESIEMIKLIIEKKVDLSDLFLELIGFKDAIQYTLKSLVKCSLSQQKSLNNNNNKLINLYKECYKTTFKLPDDMSCDNSIKEIDKVLRQIKLLKNQYDNDNDNQ